MEIGTMEELDAMEDLSDDYDPSKNLTGLDNSPNLIDLNSPNLIDLDTPANINATQSKPNPSSASDWS